MKNLHRTADRKTKKWGLTSLVLACLACGHWSTACSRGSQFDGASKTKLNLPTDPAGDALGSGDQNGSATDSHGDFSLTCQDKTATSPFFFKGQKTPRVLIPIECQIPLETQTPPNYNIDIVFVLDVTGSMGSSLLAVRKDLKNFVSALESKGWKIRVGAVPFEDKIVEDGVIRPQSNVTDVLGQMESKQLWTPQLGFGGDAPEVGLAAIERGVTLLSENVTSVQPSQNHKLLVYVSDAPAQRTKKGGFSVVETSQNLKTFKEKVVAAGGSFNLVVATTDSRKGLFDEMPTPRDQMKDLTAQAGVSATFNAVPFVASAYTAIDNLLDKTPRTMTANVPCLLRSVEIKTATGLRLLEEKNLSGNMASDKNWAAELGDYAMSKNQAIHIERSCEGQPYTQNILADF